MTVIIDYGVGNLFSLKSGFAAVGENCEVSGDADVIAAADRIVLPGVGAFGDAANKLAATGLVPLIKQKAALGVPLLGICLGMQLLFVSSGEFGRHYGLGLLGGRVESLKSDLDRCNLDLKIPHIGWNSLTVHRPENPLMKYTKDGDYVYFVHSYYAVDCSRSLVATADYGVPVPAVCAADNVFGCQFHPEKSGAAGLRILKAFCEVGR